METNIYSATGSTLYFNSSETTFGGDIFVWTNEEIARLIQIIVRPILVVLGTIGNISQFIL